MSGQSTQRNETYTQLSHIGRHVVTGAPAFAACRLAVAMSHWQRPVLYVCPDEPALTRISEILAWLDAKLSRISVSAWDCLPFDRISPTSDAVARRLDGLCRLANLHHQEARLVVLTTAAALTQRVIPPHRTKDMALEIALGDHKRDRLLDFIQIHGYNRTDIVTDRGEYAIRGGLIDLFGPGMAHPARLDFIGDELDGIRLFSAETQRSLPVDHPNHHDTKQLRLVSVSEVVLDEDIITGFRDRYRAAFGPESARDPLYEAVSAGRRFDGMEHWLSLFQPDLVTLFDYLPPETPAIYDDGTETAMQSSFEMIADLHQGRTNPIATNIDAETGIDKLPYRALPSAALYLTEDELAARLATRSCAVTQSWSNDETLAGVIELGGQPVPRFFEARSRSDNAVWQQASEYIRNQRRTGKRVVVGISSKGTGARVMSLFRDHGIDQWQEAADWQALAHMPQETIMLARIPVLQGCIYEDVVVIAESELLGDRPVRSARRKKSEQALISPSSLNKDDLVVHEEYGIGRYIGLQTLEVGTAPHDCLSILYEDDAKLFIPVENIDVLTRYGDSESEVKLDRLGSVAWQNRMARVRKRLRDIADQLLKIAAQRVLGTAPVLAVEGALLDDFSTRFPYIETEDQIRAIQETLTDLISGQPMDRLICGDVGFGKTEIALRAAFVASMAGHQVAVLTPTTLLARQHGQLFTERFAGYPARIGQISRLISAREASHTRTGIADGTIDIAIGTHALLGKKVEFSRLGLIIVDEEHRFGVAQKERFKEMGKNCHLLSLTATPIPRTLQMALSGVRTMSLISAPPIDRLAVRTNIGPFDHVIVRQALMREQLRGGQSFFVCPRIRDLPGIVSALAEITPELRTISIHGKDTPAVIERTMMAFQDRRYDVLITTNIIESGLDLPAVNTIIIYRPDRFGLAQLHQLRGRVGRGKRRGYAFLTLGQGAVLSGTATRRLEAMTRYNQLGAGLQLANHDLDIRGAGNLLGAEQSGHIREVGTELYQQLLEEAVTRARHSSDSDGTDHETWSPQIHLGISVMLPETYVSDLGLRLGLYQRIAGLQELDDIDHFTAELIDRFGSLPEEVENLLQVVKIKHLCRSAGISRVKAGPKGAVISFHRDRFARPQALIQIIANNPRQFSLRPDHRLVWRKDFPTLRSRVSGTVRMIRKLAEMAANRELS